MPNYMRASKVLTAFGEHTPLPVGLLPIMEADLHRSRGPLTYICIYTRKCTYWSDLGIYANSMWYVCIYGCSSINEFWRVSRRENSMSHPGCYRFGSTWIWNDLGGNFGTIWANLTADLHEPSRGGLRHRWCPERPMQRGPERPREAQRRPESPDSLESPTNIDFMCIFADQNLGQGFLSIQGCRKASPPPILTIRKKMWRIYAFSAIGRQNIDFLPKSSNYLSKGPRRNNL